MASTSTTVSTSAQSSHLSVSTVVSAAQTWTDMSAAVRPDSTDSTANTVRVDLTYSC